jgi:hypothetical protein
MIPLKRNACIDIEIAHPDINHPTMFPLNAIKG